MFEAKITVAIPGLEALAAAIMRMGAPVIPAPGPATPANPTPAPVGGPTPYQPSATTAQTGYPVTTAPSNPMSANPTLAAAPTPAPGPAVGAPPQTAAPIAPTAPAPSYTPDQLGTAGADMIRDTPAKIEQLLALLGQFGVQAITELKPDQLGAFATSLRGMGARI